MFRQVMFIRQEKKTLLSLQGLKTGFRETQQESGALSAAICFSYHIVPFKNWSFMIGFTSGI